MNLVCSFQRLKCIFVTLLYISWFGHSSTKSIFETLQVSKLGTPVFIKSYEDREPYSEGCRSKATGGEITVEYSRNENVFFVLVFQDLDLPEGSNLEIYADSSSLIYPDPPVLNGSVWSRSVVSFVGKSLFIDFYIPDVEKGCYAGFTASVTLYQESFDITEEPYPVTTCPSVGDPTMSGIVQLSSYDNENLFGQLFYDCVWQLKVPPGLPYFKMFLRITNVNIKKGFLKITSGISSEDQVLLEYDSSDHILNEKSFPQDKNGFISDRGLYVHLKMPLFSGNMRNHFYIQFVYGIFQETQQEGLDCSLTIKPDHEISGFLCSGSRWCVPQEYKCNGVITCADGSDEDATNCPGNSYSSLGLPEARQVPVKTTRERLPFGAAMGSDLGYCSLKRCDDESCIPYSRYCPRYSCHDYWENECADGSCVHHYERCNDECKQDEVKCFGKCIWHGSICHPDGSGTGEGTCPSFSPNKCRSYSYSNFECYSESDRCDGVDDCLDGTDEDFCVDSIYNISVIAVVAPIVIVVVVILVICCITHRYYKKHRGRGGGRYNVNYASAPVNTSGTAMTPVPATPAPAPEPIPTYPISQPTAVPSAPQENNRQDPSAPPPSYNQVMSQRNPHDPDLPPYEHAVAQGAVV